MKPNYRPGKHMLTVVGKQRHTNLTERSREASGALAGTILALAAVLAWHFGAWACAKAKPYGGLVCLTALCRKPGRVLHMVMNWGWLCTHTTDKMGWGSFQCFPFWNRKLTVWQMWCNQPYAWWIKGKMWGDIGLYAHRSRSGLQKTQQGSGRCRQHRCHRWSKAWCCKALNG